MRLDANGLSLNMLEIIGASDLWVLKETPDLMDISLIIKT